MAKFVKISRSWYVWDDSTPFEAATVLDPHKEAYSTKVNLSTKEVFDAETFADLDWTNTSIMSEIIKVSDFNVNDLSKKPSVVGKLGWLDRNGNYYVCNFNNHDLQAKFVHNTKRRTLEQIGWIHISERRNGDIVADFFGNYEEGCLPTNKQLKFLSLNRHIACSSVMRAIMNGNEKKERLFVHKIEEIEQQIEEAHNAFFQRTNE